MELLYGDRTEKLIRGFYLVQNEVGLGRDEEAYHQAFKLWLAAEELPVASKPPVPLMLAGREAHVLFPDFIAWGEITIEIKSLPRKLGVVEELQLFDYLRASKNRLGLLVNMGLDRVHFERRIYDPPTTTCTEDWTAWTNHITDRDRDIGMAIRAALHLVYQTHRTGYGGEIIERLLLFALQLQGLPVIARPPAKATFRGIVVHESPLDCFVIDSRVILTLTSLFDDNSFATSLGRSCMKTLELPWGVAINFGRTNLQITALRNSTKTSTLTRFP